jgi:hypothetical protein
MCVRRGLYHLQTILVKVIFPFDDLNYWKILTVSVDPLYLLIGYTIP